MTILMTMTMVMTMRILMTKAILMTMTLTMTMTTAIPEHRLLSFSKEGLLEVASFKVFPN